MNIGKPLDEGGATFWTITGLLGVGAIGVVDALTGKEIGFSSFYLIPIMFATWFGSRTIGLVISVAAAAAWFVADEVAGQVYSGPFIRYWNAGIRLSFFTIVTFLLPTLKALERERELARLDGLTGAANRRYFFEIADKELERSQRYEHPFTLVYIDIDRFKGVNDQKGHQAGDDLLRAVVDRAMRHLRKSDALARIGGDEFIILLPETGAPAARAAVPKIQQALDDEMKRREWPVTFSIGTLTCVDANTTTDELVKRADDLMYSVKKQGKNGIAYGTYPA